MQIKPSTALQSDYSQIARLAKLSGEPIYITHKGEADLVVMSMDAYEEREKMLDHRASVLEAEFTRLDGGIHPLFEGSRRHAEGAVPPCKRIGLNFSRPPGRIWARLQSAAGGMLPVPRSRSPATFSVPWMGFPISPTWGRRIRTRFWPRLDFGNWRAGSTLWSTGPWD